MNASVQVSQAGMHKHMIAQTILKAVRGTHISICRHSSRSTDSQRWSLNKLSARASSQTTCIYFFIPIELPCSEAGKSTDNTHMPEMEQRLTPTPSVLCILPFLRFSCCNVATIITAVTADKHSRGIFDNMKSMGWIDKLPCLGFV